MSGGRPADPDCREGVFFAALFLLSRIVLLVVLGELLHGQEPADDVFMHMRMVRHPLGLLTGSSPEVAQHPPFLPVMEAIFAWPLQLLLPDFYALRLAYVLYEGISGAFLWSILGRRQVASGLRRAILLAFVLFPVGWMTSVAMAQDETIAAAFLGAVLWLADRGRWWPSLAVCGTGVVAAKIYLALPLLALIVCLPVSAMPVRALVGLAPALVVYGAAYLPALLLEGRFPLSTFTPDPAISVNLWGLLWDLARPPLATAKAVSAALVAAATGAILLRAGRRGERGAAAATSLVAVTLLWFLVLFYLVNPEYYLLVFVPLLALAASRGELAAILVATTLPWAVNFFFAIQLFARYGGTPGKRVIYEAYRALTGASPHLPFLVCLGLCTAATLALAVAATRRGMASASAR